MNNFQEGIKVNKFSGRYKSEQAARLSPRRSWRKEGVMKCLFKTLIEFVAKCGDTQ